MQPAWVQVARLPRTRRVEVQDKYQHKPYEESTVTHQSNETKVGRCLNVVLAEVDLELLLKIT